MAPRSGSKRLASHDSEDEMPVDDEPGDTPAKRVKWDVTPEASEPNQTNSDPGSPSKLCMAVFCQHGRVGCAYYDPVKRIIYVLEDSREGSHYDLTKMLVDHITPDIVLTSSRADEVSISLLQNYAEASGNTFQIRPHREFLASKGRNRLLSLRFLAELSEDSDVISEVSSDPSTRTDVRNAYDFMQRRNQVRGDPNAKRWNAAIRLANFASLESAPLCLSSIGALIDLLILERTVGELDQGGPEALEIQNIEVLSLDMVMHINADALYSLQVFENESHASMHSDKTKEGLSLFGILNTTRTSSGRSLMRTWFLRPSLSLSVLEGRHNAVECFLNAENSPSVVALQSHLKGITNVPKTLGSLKSGKGTIGDWQSLVKFTYHFSMLRDALSELYHCGGVEVVQKLLHVTDESGFRAIGNVVNETIDWEESAAVERVCIRPHIDKSLDNKKHIYRGIDSVLSKVAEQISRIVPSDYATSLNVVYFPQLGFLIAVPMLEEWKSEAGIQVFEGWTFQFSSDSHVYFKSKEMHDMDLHVGDLHPEIVDREIELVQELLEKILPFNESIVYACDLCAELDCLLSFAEAAKTYNYRRPRIVDGSIIDIVQGRHPLQELTVDVFVPNDARLVGSSGFGEKYTLNNSDMGDSSTGNSIVLCTGANACGKSVYLKQIALIQYMAQIGSFVPAESATLGIVDKLFTRIQTRESVSKVQSAFMIDLNQVSLALRNCTSKSLILLDEFGKGSVSTDGAGLFCGVLKHLLQRGAECPKVLAATHFHEVFREDLLDPDSLPITFLHMQVLLTSRDSDVLVIDKSATSGIQESDERDASCLSKPGEEITYIYRVAPGLSYSSHAAECAAMFGLPHRIVARAQHVSKLLATHGLGELLEEQMTAEERMDLQAAEEVVRKFLEWDLTSEEAIHQGGVKARLARILGPDQK